MIERLIGRRLQAARKSVLLLGPRQTGKSTLVHGLTPDLTINLARESEFLTFSSNPSALEERIGAARPATVFVDEVQRLPALLNTLQALIDDTKRAGAPLKFFLTGSSARKLRRGQANLLPGRILQYALGPLTARELGAAFDARRALELGTLPEPYLEQERPAAEKLLDSYAGIYLREEIQAEALSRNIEGFSRFLTVAAACSGQSLDLSKLAQRARVSRTSTLRYFEMLEDTLLVYRLTPYPGAPKADLVKHPKVYFFDPGVLNGLLGNFSASPDRIGSLFEHLVVSQLHAMAMARDVKIDLHTFRTRGGLEVDFIVTKGDAVWAVEAKTAENIQTRDSDSLEAAKVYLPRRTRRIIAVPSGAPRRLANGVEILSLARLVDEIA
jgi:predicted AAA+ superfamily ATPase